MELKSKLNPKRFIIRNKIPVEELDPVKCENCRHEFKGHFCPNCGQEVAEFNRPFGFILYDFVGNFFAFDTRFLQTFKYLLFRPGYLTSEFFRGKRMSYSPPFRIFVFLSFFLFILLQALTERSLDKVAELKMTDSSEQVRLNSGLVLKADVSVAADSTERVNPDSLAMFPGLKKGEIQEEDGDLNIDFALLGKGKIRDNLGRWADQLQDKLEKTDDPAERKKLNSYIAMCRAPEMVISNIMKYLSWAFFILLPLFALVLKLFYIRRKQLYIRHLIFSIHLHSYLFFILILVVSLKLIFTWDLSLLNLILLISFPVYFMLALRRFYAQHWGKTILKFIGISLIYNAMLWAAVILVFVKSLGISMT